MKYELERSAHSVHALHYHLIIVVKYRRKALYSEAVRKHLKEIVLEQAEKLGIQIVAQESSDDHHILFNAKPTVNISKVAQQIKGASSRLLRLEYPETKKYLWGDSL